MITSNLAQTDGLRIIILGVLFLIIGLFVYAVIMPLALPFINMINSYDDVDTLTKFLFGLVPFMALIGVIVIAIK